MLERLGVTTINNATGNLKFPRVSAKAVGTEETEVSADADSTMEMDELTLSPVRVANKTTYSKQLILQGGPGIDALIANELVAGINETIDKAGFAKASAGAGSSTDKASAALAAADVFTAEKAVLAAGGDLSRCAFVGSPTAMSIVKGEAAIASIKALVENGNIDAFNTSFTPNLVDSTADEGELLFADWQKALVLAYFGGVDILVDPYSSAGTAQINLHVNKFYDCEVQRAGAVARIFDFT